MFTGIVREIGSIRAARRGRGVTVLEIEGPTVPHGLAVGDSVAVNGVCLTVTAQRGSRFCADVSPETRRATTAGSWRPGDDVHLEPSLRASDSLGGHFVLGHVDGVGRVLGVRRFGDSRQVEIAAPAHLLGLLLPKGSIAVDGVSLTLDAGPFGRSFTVTLIPETLRATRFGSLKPAQAVNLEADVLAKVARHHQAGSARPAAGAHDAPDGGMTVRDILRRGWR